MAIRVGKSRSMTAQRPDNQPQGAEYDHAEKQAEHTPPENPRSPGILRIIIRAGHSPIHNKQTGNRTQSPDSGHNQLLSWKQIPRKNVIKQKRAEQQAELDRKKEENLQNFSILTANKTMPNAYQALKGSADAFLYPGHVNAITGEEEYVRLICSNGAIFILYFSKGKTSKIYFEKENDELIHLMDKFFREKEETSGPKIPIYANYSISKNNQDLVQEKLEESFSIVKKDVKNLQLDISLKYRITMIKSL